MNDIAKTILKYMTLDDPESENRITNGIEQNRKGFASIELQHKDGSPVEKAEISFNLKKHEYHFGCNAFMLGQFNDDKKNAIYEEKFS